MRGVGSQEEACSPCCVLACVNTAEAPVGLSRRPTRATAALSGWRGRTCREEEEGFLGGRPGGPGLPAGLRERRGSQAFLCPLSLSAGLAEPCHLRCWLGQTAGWVAGHPGPVWYKASRGPRELFLLVAWADSQGLLTISGIRRLP